MSDLRAALAAQLEAQKMIQDYVKASLVVLQGHSGGVPSGKCERRGCRQPEKAGWWWRMMESFTFDCFITLSF
jgi:hypothetical protein